MILINILMDELYNLKGKTAWITGGKRIGRKIAEVLAQHGANLILSYNSSSKEAEDTARKIKKFGIETMLVKVDVSSHQSVADAVSEIKNHFKKIDILLLMASVFSKTKLESVNDEDLQKNFDIHVKGTFWPIQSSLGLMPKGSHIITISDRTSLGIAYSEYLPYIITKGTVMQMTKVLAVELGPRGIFVNSIAPGPVLKPEGMPDDDWNKIRQHSVVKYPITDEEAVTEFAKLVLYLSATRSTGSVYALDFGHLY